MSVRPIFAWFDLWVGVFIDRPKGRIYVFPLPCIGFVITRKRCGHGVLRDAWCADCEGMEPF